jgi:serine/threonine-protein kinase HipA
MKLAMAVGTNRHYAVHTIVGRHFMQTAKSCGLPDQMVEEVIQELTDTTASGIDQILSGLPKGFPETVTTSIHQCWREAASEVLGQDRR